MTEKHIQDAYPLSYTQMGMLYHQQLNKQDAVYHDIIIQKVALPLDIERLQSCIDEIVDANEILRSTFELGRFKQSLQLVHRLFSIPVEVIDLTDKQGDEYKDAKLSWIASEKERGFELESSPLFRVFALQKVQDSFEIVFSFHHAILDGFSVRSLTTELLRCYQLALENKEYQVKKSATKYRDFIAAEKKSINSKATQEYWNKLLSNHTLSEVKSASVHDDFDDSQRHAAQIKIADKTAHKLELLRQALGVSYKSLLLTAHQRAISALSGKKDVISGLVVNGRPEKLGAESVLGLFLNTVPFRTKIEKQSWSELIKDIAESETELLPHRRYPLGLLKKEHNGAEFFNHIFNYTSFDESSHLEKQDLDDVRGFEKTNYAFTVQATYNKSDKRPEVFIELDKSSYTSNDLKRFIGVYESILNRMAEAPESTCCHLELKYDNQQQPVIFQIDSIVSLFEQACQRFATNTALSFKQQSLSYQQLDMASNRIAHGLIAKGVQRGKLVGVCCEHSNDLIVTLLAILKTGAAYIPIDPKQALERQVDILEDAKPALVIVQDRLEAWGDGIAQYTSGEIAVDNEQSVDVQVSEQDLAYVLYTSGSTGRPNGVKVTHNNVSRLFKSTHTWFEFDHTDVWTLFHSYAFDFSVWEMWGALLHGGRLVIPERHITRDPQSFAQLVCEQGVTVLNQTPTAFYAVMPHLIAQRDKHQLRQLVFGGEALELCKLLPWFDAGNACDNTRLVNMYGITETTVHVTYRPVTRDDCVRPDAGSLIGQALPDLDIQLLDEWQQPVPTGVPGEIYIRGAGVSEGYLNRPELTSQRFVHLPDSECCWYRSGDIARRLDNGDIEYLGRCDHQVKIRGHRVELSDISRQLLKLDGINDAVVIMYHTAQNEPLLSAYYTGTPIESPELSAYLHAYLPEYMVPVAYVHIEEMPLTINGKLDQKALPAPGLSDRIGSGELQAPRSAIESLLCQIWQEVLGLKEIGINLGFSALGGDSISSLQVVGKLRKQGYQLSLQDLFQYQTIEAVALHVVQNDADERYAAFDLIDPVSRAQLPDTIEDAYPVSQLQQGMLYHSRRSPGDGVYHDIVHYPVDLSFDAACLKATLDNLTSRHDMLRTQIALDTYEQPLLLVHKTAEVELQIYQIAENEHTSALSQWLAKEHARGFAPEDYPLLRVAAHVVSEDKFILSFSNHHAIVDGLSEASLIAELLSEYRRRLSNDWVEAAPLQASYRSFIAMEQQALSDKAHKAYWTHLDGVTVSQVQLAAADEPQADEHVLELSLSDAVSCSLGSELSSALRALGQRSGYSLKTLLLSAHLKALSLACASERVVTGGSFHGRPEVIDSEKVLGLFVSILPVCVELPKGNWLSLIEAVDKHCREIERHRFYPLAQIKRDLDGHALFDVSFNYTQFNVLWQDDSEAGTQLNNQRGGIAENSLPFNVNVQSYPDRDDIYFSVETLKEHYPVGVGLSYSRLYRQVLDRMANNTDQSHRQIFTNELSTKELSEYQADSIVSLFEQACQRFATNTALSFKQQSLSYQQLDMASNRIAHGLIAKGVQRGKLVGVCCEHSNDLIVTLLAILKTGAAYIPIDPKQALERQVDILEDAKPALVIVQDRLEAWGDGIAQYTSGEIAVDNEQSVDVQVSEQDLAYVLYTSGSTGRPNGVKVTHNNVSRLFKSTHTWFEFDHTDVWTLFHSYAFDFSVWEMWGALLHGGRLVIPERHITRDPQSFAQLVCEQGVTVLNQTPTAFYAVMPHLIAQRDKHQLRQLVFGGEALELCKLLPWFDAGNACDNTRLVNMYGITETTVHVTYRPVTRDDCVRPDAGSLIGQALPDLDIQLLDEWQQPVPTGVPGEIYIRGAGVSEGYLNRPELTSQRFVHLPDSECCWYRSGDIARRLDNGDIEYLGRCDHQVKIRGHRVELSDISRQLLKLDGINDAVVIMYHTAQNEPLLSAYYTGTPIESPELSAYLHAYLPEYMVPVAYVHIEEMPLTINGKLDQKALPAPGLSDRIGSGELQAPRSAIESLLCQIWQEVLGLKEIGINLGFSALGGDSISSLQVVGKLRKQGYQLSLQDLFQYQTIEAVALHVVQNDADERYAAFDLIDPVSRAQLPDTIEDAYPVSQLQQGMLYHSRRSPGDGVYHDIVHYPVDLSFDAACLKATLDNLTSRHDMLRTQIALDTYEQPLLLVHKTAEVELQIYQIAENEHTSALSQWLAKEHARGFAPEDYPLLRVAAHVVSEDKFILSFSNHHAIVDGLSEASLIAELLSEYRRRLSNDWVEAAPLQASYRSFIAMEQQALSDKAHKAYWTHLDGVTVSQVQLVAADEPQADEHVLELSLSDAVSCSLGSELSSALRALGQRSGYSLKTLLLSAHLKALSLACASERVVTGGSFHGRPEVIDSEKVLGLFVSILPVCVELPKGNWLSLIEAVDKHCREIERHRFYPLAQIKRDLDGHALFDVSFNYTQFNVLWQDDSEAGTQLNNQRGGIAENSLPFSVNVQSYPDRDDIYFSVTTLKEHYPAGVGLSYSRLYRQVLSQMLQHTQSAHDNVVSESDLASLRQWNDTGAPLVQWCLHELFEGQVRARPQAIAVTYGQTSLTYAQVNAQANQLARYLQAQRQVSAETLVGVCLPRSFQLLVAILAVLKAGGAYVPLDPTYPTERLSMMQKDADLHTIVTSHELDSQSWLSSAEQVVIDSEQVQSALAEQSMDDLRLPCKPEQLAYVMYTSGSTGMPKGVMVEHRNVASLVCDVHHIDLTTQTKTLLHSPICFDAATFEIWAAWLNGGCIAVHQGNSADVEALASSIKCFGVSTLWMTSGLFDVFSELVQYPLPALQQLLVGGDVVNPQAVRAVQKRNPQLQCFNGYGPTENTTFSTLYRIPDEISDTTALPIGQPLDNRQCYVLNTHLQALPIGVTGELYVGGAGVARAYLNREDLTEQRFIDNPFYDPAQTGSSRKLYRTGDLVRWQADGQLYYLGRNDFQVKLRGFRIELGDIENALLKQEGVKEALVLAQESPAGKHLVAYYRAKERFNSDVLRQRLSQQLPDYMLPQYLINVAQFPLTANGKIDRSALPAPQLQETQAYEAPQGQTEQALADIWKELLGIERVSRHDNFFMLGGHSLLVTRLLKKINEKFKAKLSLNDLLALPTLVSQADSIDTHLWLADSAKTTSDHGEVLKL
ncbi:amino acid adenylation domain-containing protein [Ningiella sp. W23]|uniref:non-ribosomal peptide synthetase n=1 Tax=Ningiella sp. W23 TaxID=3023715 RepID=UPI0037575EE2